ncbi:LysE family translocator [Gallaecimonas kandeliae]|uniref:LysE family translocator n=1 Tax=Gallaecimonas kandeliae TaxID=3029055 RepID=UPI002648DB3D|nr:LysE family translocator [Gallaecimonas kandeliae]WKE65558.1 LysE family translocator [Gallaecimonas kandeliae]
MPLEQLWTLVLFAFATTFSPGPNNIMLMTSGANVGFWRSLPHMLGVVIGFSLMVILVGLGLTGLFTAYPWLHQVLKVAGMLYLAYLAVKIAFSKPREVGVSYRPMGFWAAAAFQWVNPKGWTMALTAVSLYNPAATWLALGLIALVFASINLPSVCVWTAAGSQLSRLLSQPHWLRRFNLLMAVLLLGSTLPLL